MAALLAAQDAIQSAGTAGGWAVLGASRIVERGFLPALAALWQRPNRVYLPGEHVRGIYSRNHARAGALASRHAIPTATGQLTPLLDRHDVQYVYVASRPRDHAAQVKAALRAGKHVLCEPPLALSSDEAETLTFMAANRGLMLGVNQLTRARPLLRKLKDLLLADYIGEPLGLRISNTALLPLDQQTWRLEPLDGGVYFTRTLDSVDAFEFLLDSHAATVVAWPGERVLASDATVVEELFTLITPARGSLRINLHDALFIPHASEMIEITGTRGTLLAESWTAPADRASLYHLRAGQRTRLDNGAMGTSFDDPYVASLCMFWAAALGFSSQPVFDGQTHCGQLRTVTMIAKAASSNRAFAV